MCALIDRVVVRFDWFEGFANGKNILFFVFQENNRLKHLKKIFSKMFGNIVPLTTVGAGQVLPTNTVGNNDLVIIQDTTTATTQAELINQLQNHITENQQILIITDDQGQDQCKIVLRKMDYVLTGISFRFRCYYR